LALEPVIGYLRGLGVAPAPTILPLSPLHELVERYRRYLLVEPALTVGSVRIYLQTVRLFLATFDGSERVEIDRITTAEVSAFVLEEASRRPGTSIGSVATALRSLLGFLHVEGMLQCSLTGAVPGVGAWRGAALPRPLAAGELRRLLASCDRRPIQAPATGICPPSRNYSRSPPLDSKTT
jgi:site-specific recombinase XerD